MYKINSETGYDCEILIYDEIGGFGITAKELVSRIQAQQPEHIKLRINSCGGDTVEAISIYNYLKSLSAIKDVVIDGIAASAASLIAMCGDSVLMPSNAMMMIHNPWGYCQGDKNEMLNMAAVLEKFGESSISIYEAKTKLPREEIRQLMDKETWLNAEEAKAKGFADSIIEGIEMKASDAEKFKSGVEYERERLKALDELMSPGREDIIMKAKYETFKSASAVAMEILKSERAKNEEKLRERRIDSYELDDIQVYNAKKNNDEQRICSDILNRMRGYK